MFDPSWLDLFKKKLLTLNQLLISEPIFLYLEMVNLHNYYLNNLLSVSYLQQNCFLNFHFS